MHIKTYIGAPLLSKRKIAGGHMHNDRAYRYLIARVVTLVRTPAGQKIRQTIFHLYVHNNRGDTGWTSKMATFPVLRSNEHVQAAPARRVAELLNNTYLELPQYHSRNPIVLSLLHVDSTGDRQHNTKRRSVLRAPPSQPCAPHPAHDRRVHPLSSIEK